MILKLGWGDSDKPCLSTEKKLKSGSTFNPFLFSPGAVSPPCLLLGVVPLTQSRKLWIVPILMALNNILFCKEERVKKRRWRSLKDKKKKGTEEKSNIFSRVFLKGLWLKSDDWDQSSALGKKIEFKRNTPNQGPVSKTSTSEFQPNVLISFLPGSKWNCTCYSGENCSGRVPARWLSIFPQIPCRLLGGCQELAVGTSNKGRTRRNKTRDKSHLGQDWRDRTGFWAVLVHLSLPGIGGE